MRAIAFAIVSSAALAANYDVGDVAIVEDTTGAIHSGQMLQTTFCQLTAKEFLKSHPDQFDGVITFAGGTISDFQNVQQGTPTKNDVDGIGLAKWDWSGQYGSAGKLSQCVFMADLAKLPASPDDPVMIPFIFPLPLGVTGVELVGHEYGHHWMAWIEYDKNDGMGRKENLRGSEDNGPNGHWSAFHNTGSVMYGNFITDLGGGQFHMEGGDRKYSEVDQYLMGLRKPTDVKPFFYIEDGSDAGNPAVPLGKGKTHDVTGARVNVTIDDVIRAVGPRNPPAGAPGTQKCWRMAFILVAPQGASATPAQIAKVEAYRKRFTQWFTWATDGLGTADTRLTGPALCGTPTDGGTPADAGVKDAGTAADAGSTPADAGAPDAGCAGELCNPKPPPDQPVPLRDLGDNGAETGKLRAGCGCGTIDGVVAFVGLALLALWRRNRRD